MTTTIKNIIFCLLFINIISCGAKEDKSNNIIKDYVNNKKEEKLQKVSTETENSSADRYAVSKYFTPVLNTSDFESVYGGRDGRTLKRSKTGLIKELEYVAYPGSVFKILKELKKDEHYVYEVYAEDYDIPELNIKLYIDSRFVSITDTMPEIRKRDIPTKEKIYEYLDKSVGALYVWGANNIEGVEQMLEFYPPKGELSPTEKKEWGIKGVDCSGLIYEASNGNTARMTYQMVNAGDAVEIEGLSIRQIMDVIEPLDYIVWKGHTILIYDRNTTIESSHSAGGVVKKNLYDVLKNISKKRKPLNNWVDGNNFVIRRWYKK